MADEQDIYKANNTWKQAEFAANAPGLDWAEYFRGAGLSGQASFIVWQPSAFAGESALVASTALDTWKDWLAFHLIEDYADVLPKALVDEHFAFFEQDPLRQNRTASALAARRRLVQRPVGQSWNIYACRPRRARRRCRANVRPALFPTGNQGPDRSHGCEHHRRLPAPH